MPVQPCRLHGTSVVALTLDDVAEANRAAGEGDTSRAASTNQPVVTDR
jgi:hypothetical protein